MSLTKRLFEYFYMQLEEEDPEKPVVGEVIGEDDKDAFIDYVNKNPNNE